MQPPVARTEIVRVTHHGHTSEDPYAWLKDPNWQEVMRDPDLLDAGIRAHLEAENAYTDRVLAPTDALQQELFLEMRGRIKEDDASVPAPDGPWQYFERFRQDGQYPIFCRRPRTAPDTEEQILFDGDAEGEGKPFFRLAAVQHSPDHRRLAYGVDEQGSEFYTIRVRDLDSGTDLPDAVPDASGDLEWAADGQSFFYTKLDENHRPKWVYLHRLRSGSGSGLSTSDPNNPQRELSTSDQNESAPSEDLLIYEEHDPGFFIGLNRSEGNGIIFLSSHDHETSEVRLLDTAFPERDAVLVAPRQGGTLYELSEHGGRLYVLTNQDGAEDFKVLETTVDAPYPDAWREIVPHRPGVLILGLAAFEHHLIRLETEEGLPRIVVRDLAAQEESTIDVDEDAFSLGVVPLYEYGDTLRYTYSSPTTPLRVYDYNLSTAARILRKEQQIPSGHDPDDYVVRRIHAPSHDGERVPITVLHHRDTPLDGSAPCLLYGYGSYGLSMPAGFETNRLSLVDRGFVYAVAHVRGGKEGGYRWYRTGKREHKKNTFLDFIAAADELASRTDSGQAYTSAGRIVIFGGSAGGMLVGATLNLAPNGLIGGAIAEVPFVDVLNTMLDADLPLTPPEWPEWGNPISDPDAYDYIRSYSPYDNLAPRDYPPLLVTAGLTDPRVTYWEPAKWVARLRTIKTDANHLLLRTRMGAGHAGASGRFDHLKELAEVYAFACLVASPPD